MPAPSGKHPDDGGQARQALSEFHEQLIERLFTIGMTASDLEERLVDPLLQQQVREMVESLDEVITDVRSATVHLLPKIEDQ